ncbi:hypothetical protein pipiens_004514 [Culex pipiens pipiens]|uniref:Uncharacterized protein n=1 Tax=Culex pipiens pipiens TaxID=38569 RepID=A0ABD1CJG9_CULPP
MNGTHKPQLATIGIAIREVHFENNADYAKVFITLRNGTGSSSSSTVVDIDALIYQNISSGLQLRMDLDCPGGRFRSSVSNAARVNR